MESKSFNWDAADFFRRLTETNKLARSKNFKFCLVSSLEGFEEALARMQSSTAFVCVSDVSSGSTDLTNSPHTVRTKTVFFAVRHKIDDMKARMEAFDLQREIFLPVHVETDSREHAPRREPNLHRPENPIQRDRQIFLFRLRLLLFQHIRKYIHRFKT